MKQIKTPWLFAFCIVLQLQSGAALAQQLGTLGETHAVLGNFGYDPFTTHSDSHGSAPSFYSPLSNDVAINFFQSNLPAHDWGGGYVYTPYLIFGFGERMTLANTVGFVDSVAVTLDSISSDSIRVLLFPDTLYTTSQDGPQYLMNIFDPNANSFGVKTIYASQIHGRTRVVVPFDHAQVPKDFFVTVIANAGKNIYQLVGDSESVHPITTDNARSGWLGENQSSQFATYFLDGKLTPSGDAYPLYSNFDITAYVSSSPSGVSAALNNSAALRLSPNPASSRSDVSVPMSSKSQMISVFDLLGRKVLEQEVRAGNARTRLDVARLPNGTYRVVSENGSESTPLVIQR